MLLGIRKLLWAPDVMVSKSNKADFDHASAKMHGEQWEKYDAKLKNFVNFTHENLQPLGTNLRAPSGGILRPY